MFETVSNPASTDLNLTLTDLIVRTRLSKLDLGRFTALLECNLEILPRICRFSREQERMFVTGGREQKSLVKQQANSRLQFSQS